MNVLEQLYNQEQQDFLLNVTGGNFKPSEYRMGFAKMMMMVYGKIKLKDIDDYKYLPRYSDEEIRVFVDYKNKEIVFVGRGSITKEDWLLSDAVIVSGSVTAFKMTPRYRRNKKLVMDTLKDFPNYKVVLVGHSLSGFVATTLYEELKPRYDVKFIVFNRGTGFNENFEETPVDYKNRIHYHTFGDVLSSFYLQDKRTKHNVEIPTEKNLHGIINFTKKLK
jgi:hypothetical protein